MSKFNSTSRHYPSVLSAALLMALFIGCNGNQRVEVDGEVTVDGQPLDGGYISLRPLPETGGPTAGAKVSDGKFHIPAEQGTFPGSFRVEITASRKTGRQVGDDFSGGMADVYEQYLPTHYNTESELTAELKADERNDLRFDLQSGDLPAER